MKTSHRIIMIIQTVLIVVFVVYALIQQKVAVLAFNEAKRQEALVRENAILAQGNAERAQIAEAKCLGLQKQLDEMKKSKR